MPLPQELTLFGQALAGYGLGNCLANDTTLWIGADGSQDWPNSRRVKACPAARVRVDFLAAPVQAELIAAFIDGPEALVVEELFIGTSQWYFKSYAREDFPGYDMVEAVAALRGAYLPALRSLTLGDMEDLSGGLRMFGTVGEISHVFAAAPSLKYLGLHGNFTLDAPVRHDSLRTLEALFDNCGVTGDPITQETFSALLSSSLPNLETLLLALTDGGDDDDLNIPDAFLSPGHLPRLVDLELDRLDWKARGRLDDFLRARRIAPNG